MGINQIVGTDELERLVKTKQLSEGQAGVIHIVTHFSGCSLSHRGDELREFMSRGGIDNPKTLLNPHVSDCALFGLAVYHALGVRHRFIDEPYVVGMAPTWLYEIANDLHAIRHPVKDGPPKPGALAVYFTHGKNDGHYEFILSDVEICQSVWIAFHGGGGRPDCAIGTGHSDIKWSSGRPLQEWYDIDALMNSLRTELRTEPADADDDWNDDDENPDDHSDLSV